MSPTKHILCVTQYFHPENFRVNDLCSEWISRGYRVSVLTGIPNYPDGKFFKGYGLFRKRRETYKGIDIYRIPIFARGKSRISLVLNYLSFVVSGWFFVLFTKLKADVVFTYEISPMTQTLLGVWYSKRRKIPSYVYILDLWPENLTAVANITNKTVISAIERMNRYVFVNSTAVLASSQSFVRRLAEKGVEQGKLVFWPQYPESFYVPTNPNHPLVDKIPTNGLRIIYTGNIGYAQGLQDLVAVAHELETQNIRCVFILVGSGRAKDELVERMSENQVNHRFVLIPQMPAEVVPHLIGACDFSYLSFMANSIFEMTIPAKFQTYLACGSPIIGAVSGEVKQLIDENRLGFTTEPGNIEGIVSVIRKATTLGHAEKQILKDNALEYVQKNYSKSKVLDEFDNLIGNR